MLRSARAQLPPAAPRAALGGVRGLRGATSRRWLSSHVFLQPSTTGPRTLYDKIFDDHVVDMTSDGTALIYIDRHLVHEVTSPQAFEGLAAAGRPVRRPDCTLATVDHNIPTSSRKKFQSIESFLTGARAARSSLPLRCARRAEARVGAAQRSSRGRR